MDAEKHIHFELWLHTTRALEGHLGRSILGRETIHEWPLSCVQRIDCRNESFIYKTQREPSVEPRFYQVASSELLPSHACLGRLNGCHTMTFEYIAGTALEERRIGAPELVALAAGLQDKIAEIEGELPTHIDIGSSDRWLSFVDETLESISGLIDRSLYTQLSRETIARLREWADSAPVKELVETESVFCHGDLNGGNIILVDRGAKLVDWQRPRLAPRSVDLAGLLVSEGHDPSPHVAREAVQVLFFLMIGWVVECQLGPIAQVDYEPQVLVAAKRILGGSWSTSGEEVP